MDPCAELFRLSAQVREFQKRNPYLARFLMVHPDYFLWWPEDALGLFMWRVWESWIGVDEDVRRQVELAIMMWSMMHFPWRARRCNKIANAARMALELINWEKRVLGID